MDYKELSIEVDGKDYSVTEPTIRAWNVLSAVRELQDDYDFAVRLICVLSGLNEEQVKSANYDDVIQLSNFLADYLSGIDNSFRKEFIFKGTEYHFFNMNEMTFGEYVDIDNFLAKSEAYKNANMNEFMAILYREKNPIDGKAQKYNASDVGRRAELFKDLPVKYVNGALVFFYALGNILSNPTPKYSPIRRMKNKWILLKKNGDGIIRSISYQVKAYLISIKSGVNRLRRYLTF